MERGCRWSEGIDRGELIEIIVNPRSLIDFYSPGRSEFGK